MAITVTWQFGATTPVSVTFLNMSVVRARAMTARYARRHALIADGMTETQIGEAVIRHVMAEVARESADTQRAELLAANEATINAAVEGDNAI